MLRFQANLFAGATYAWPVRCRLTAASPSNATKGHKLADEQPEMIETCDNKRINKLMMRSSLVLLVMLAMAIGRMEQMKRRSGSRMHHGVRVFNDGRLMPGLIALRSGGWKNRPSAMSSERAFLFSAFDDMMAI